MTGNGAAGGFPIAPPLEPMLAKLATELPTGDGWLFEPKWDGFRCLAFRAGDDVLLQSKAGQPLARYFPELVQALRALPSRRFVLDGEIVIFAGGAHPLHTRAWSHNLQGSDHIPIWAELLLDG